MYLSNRLFQLEHFMEAFSLIDDMYAKQADMMTATGLLALIIWVFSATLFYTTEQKEFTAAVPSWNSEWDAGGNFGECFVFDPWLS